MQLTAEESCSRPARSGAQHSASPEAQEGKEACAARGRRHTKDARNATEARHASHARNAREARSVRLRPWDLHELAIKGLRTGNRGRLALCEALRSLHESSGFLELGFSSVAGYAAARLHLRRTECYEHLRVSKALTELPELRRAFAEGGLGWTVLKAVTRVARPATQQTWLDCLVERGPEHTIAECRHALRG
ncbi:hypothetical protein ABI59_22140 [Acidobacteria bacterium Mor1]|nr:hypothetical protein ABI59_22140 [Acidobacteria bacterium Mor1]